MKKMGLEQIIYTCCLLQAHMNAWDISRITYLCAHVLPGMDLDKVPWRKPISEWTRYMESYGIRPGEQRWVMKGIYYFRTYDDVHPDIYQREHMNHIMYSLKHIGNKLDLNEKPAESDAQSDTH